MSIFIENDNKDFLQTILCYIPDLLKNNLLRGRSKLERVKCASIEIIKEIQKHPYDNDLEIAKVLNWLCVINKNQFKKEDIIVFVQIDALIPLGKWNEFLNKRIKFKEGEGHVRTSTVKIRGTYSQGVILPLKVLPLNKQLNPVIGSDVGQILNIKKFNKAVPIRFSDEISGEFPNYLCAPTNEDNGLGNPDLVEEVLRNKTLTITQKLDGCSCTIIIKNKKIKYVCSRRNILKDIKNNSYWEAAKKINLKNIDDGYYIIQGELMGFPAAPNNQLHLTAPELYVFQVKYKEKFLKYGEMKHLCENILNIKCVPHVGDFNNEKSIIDIQYLQELSDKQKLVTKNLAEGIVIRPFDYRSGGDGRPLGFKILNRGYEDK
jgi:RNA ligase (TIGR02306 family)